MTLGPIHIAKKQIQTSQERLGVKAIEIQFLQTGASVLNPFRLALGKACSSKGHHHQEGCIG